MIKMKKVFQKIILAHIALLILSCGIHISNVVTLDSENITKDFDSDKYLKEIDFGTYKQSKKTDESESFEAPIKWKVIGIDEKNNSALIVSAYSLDYMKFYDNEKQSSWKDSSIRKWLNKDFYDTAFSTEEKKHINSAKLNNKIVEGVRVKQGDDTTDKIFLLSADEFKTYNVAENMYSFLVTGYAEGKKETIDDEMIDGSREGTQSNNSDKASLIRNFILGESDKKGSNYSFWLRNNGVDKKSIMFIDYSKGYYSENEEDRFVNYEGINGLENYLYVKPAMCVDISLVINDTKKIIDSQNTKGLTGIESDSYVYFGNYYKNNDYKLEPIEWKVISKQKDKALLMSRYGLDYKPFNEMDTQATWETSSLRKWLNEVFYNKAFSDEEKKSIIKNLSKVQSGSNGNTGRDTYDYVTLLSHSDLSKYLDLNALIQENDDITKYDSLKCYQTRYALNVYERKYNKKMRDEYNPQKWWLRDIMPTYKSALIYDYQDMALSETARFTSTNILVRPAIWVAIGENDSNDVKDEKKNESSKTISIHKDAKVINVGEYYINKIDEKEPITWDIIERDEKNKRALLLSDKIIEYATISNADKDLTWENSSIREFLNNEFINEIFSEDEKEAILYTDVNNDSKYGIAENNDSTRDKLFIMSRDEIEKYFKSMKERRLVVTKYVSEKYFNKNVRDNRKQFLRSSRYGKGYLDYIIEAKKFSNTYIDENKYSDEPSYLMAGLRLAMWVSYSEGKLNTYKAAKGNYTDVFKDMIEKKVSTDELPLAEDLVKEIDGDVYKFFGIYNDEYHSYKVRVHNGQKVLVIFELKKDDNKSYEDATYGDLGLILREIRYKYDVDDNKYISKLEPYYVDTFYDEDFNLKENGIEFRPENLLQIINGLCQGQHYRDARVKFYDKDYGWCIDTNVFALTENFRKKHDLRYSILNKEIFEEKAKSLNEQYRVSDIPSTIEIEYEMDYNDKKTEELYDEGKIQVRFDYEKEEKRYYYEIKFTHTDDNYLDDMEVTLINTKKFKKDRLSGYTYYVDEKGEFIKNLDFNNEW